MDISNLIGMIAVVILLAVSILRYRHQIRERVNKSMQAIYDLGFSVDETPDPTHVEQLSALRPGTRPTAILKKRMGSATMYAYSLVTEDSSTYNIISLYETVTIISPNLRLPHFTISPTFRSLNRITTKGMEELDKSEEFRGDEDKVERVHLGIDEAYENTHLIQGAEKTEVQRFLSARHIRELRRLPHPYDIRCYGSAFSIDFVPWDQRPDDFLKRASQDAEAIYKILSE